MLSALIDRTKFAYVPLEYYDIDRQVARMLPDDLTLGRLFVPFDLVSRTIMVACLQSIRRGGARSGPAIARLHGDVVSGASRPRSSRPCRIFTGWRAAPKRYDDEKQIFRRTHRRCPDRGRAASAEPARGSGRDPEEQGGRLLKILTDKQFVTDQDMAFSMGRCLNTPPINLSKVRVPEEILDLVPRDMAKANKLVPIARLERTSFSWRWPTRPTCSRSTT